MELRAEIIGIEHTVWKIKFQRLPKVKTFGKIAQPTSLLLL